MKKIVLWVMVAVCVAVSVEPVFATYDDYMYVDYNRTKKAKAEKFFERAEILVEDVRKLANKIARNNKYAFEAKLTQKEQSPYRDDSKVIWNRVWAKDKTLVFGFAGKKKNFEAIYLVTSDPNFVFSGGIHVGASIKTLERFFGDTINNIGVVEGKTVIVDGPHWGGPDADATIRITCMNGIITEITFDYAYGMTFVVNDYSTSKKALDFANRQAKQMGLSKLK